jgi:hypothetical protein
MRTICCPDDNSHAKEQNVREDSSAIDQEFERRARSLLANQNDV